MRLSWTSAFLLISAAPVWGQGKLSQIREEVSAPSSSTDPSHCDCDDDDEGDSVLGAILGGLLSSLFESNDNNDRHHDGHHLFEEDYSYDYSASEATSYPVGKRIDYFAPFPYYDSSDGFIRKRPEVSLEEMAPLSRWTGRFSIENGNDFDGLNRANAHLLLHTSSGLGIQSRLDFLHEDLPNDTTDDLLLGTTEIVYFFLTSEQAQTFIGLGVRYLDDQNDTDAGFNFTFGIDVFPAKPFVVSFLLDAGSLGETSVFHVRGTFGVIYHHVEVFGGYDFREIGSVNVQGPLAGVRLWF